MSKKLFAFKGKFHALHFLHAYTPNEAIQNYYADYKTDAEGYMVHDPLVEVTSLEQMLKIIDDDFNDWVNQPDWLPNHPKELKDEHLKNKGFTISFGLCWSSPPQNPSS